MPAELASPGIPERWKTSPYMWLSDTSPGGWILAHDRPGDTVTPDDVSAALLPLRFSAVDAANNSIAYGGGVDDYSIGSNDPDLKVEPYLSLPGTAKPIDERIWVMAPLGGTKSVRLFAPLHTTSRLKISATGLSFGGQTETILESSGQTFTVSANSNTASGAEIDALLEINDGAYDTPSGSKPLAFKVMKARTVKVNVYRVVYTKKYREAGAEGGSPILTRKYYPGNVPTEEGSGATFGADFESDYGGYFNGLFKPQVNTTYEFDLRPGYIDVDWDIVVADEIGDGRLATGPPAALTAEQQAIQAGIPENEPVANINLFLVATNDFFLSPGNLPIEGSGHPSSRTLWLYDPELANTTTMEELKGTGTHEAGHIIIGPGHPDEGAGAAPLPGLKHQAFKRLMATGAAQRSIEEARMLTKAEWDEIERWLKKEEDDGRLPN